MNKDTITTNIDADNQLYPFSLVWTPIPILSAIIPFIGHTGICSSKGVIHDFVGIVNINNMAFGNPTKYVQLKHLDYTASQWDKCIYDSDDVYNKEEYNLFTNNCHSYCACVLNKLKYKGRTNYNMIDIFIKMTFQRRYISIFHLVKTYIGFIIFITIIWILFRKIY